MVQPLPIQVETLTGVARVRPGFRGRQVLQVQVRRLTFRAFDFERKDALGTWMAWRDADWQDMQALPGFVIGRPEVTESKAAA